MNTELHIDLNQELKLYSSSSAAESNRTFGGKADGLLFLKRNGFRVPEFWIITGEQLASMKGDRDVIQQVIAEWINAEHIDQNTLWSVRSSAAIEDGKERSFAGLFRTQLNVNVKGLADAVLHVMEGFEAIRMTGYHSESAEGNIIIQQMLDPVISGVGFSIDPADADPEMQLLNFIPGLGTKLVSGEEEALIVRIRNGSRTFEGSGQFNGVVFRGKEVPTGMSADDVQRLVIPFLSELENGLRRLKTLKGHEVDTEFAIAGGKIFWLQVRSITAIVKQQKPDAVWDNSNIGANYPGLSLPLTVSFTAWSFSRVYSVMYRALNGSKRFLERNKALLENMCGSVNGGLYYNVTAWQQLTWQLPFGKRLSGMITKMWGTSEAKFDRPANAPGFLANVRLLANLLRSFIFFRMYRRKYYSAFEKMEREFEALDLDSMNRTELRKVYFDLDEKLAGKWFAPMLNGFFTMITFALIRRAVKRSPVNEAHPNFVNDILFNTGDVISVKLVREMQSLLREINADASLKELFTGNDDQRVWNELKAEHPAFFGRITSYISKYGDRVEEGELKFETVSYRENNLLFISFLRKNISAGVVSGNADRSFDHRAIIRRFHPFNIFKRWWLNSLVNLTISRVRDRENMRFCRTRSFAMVRSVIRRIDASLLKDELIDQRNDSLYLTCNELFQDADEKQFRSIIAERKNSYRKYSADTLQPRYHQFGNEFVPVEEESTDHSAMKGVGCCSGIVTAEVLILDQESIHSSVPDGKILLAKYFEPGWIGLFSRAAGLISERGSLLSHTAILCREIGMPSIVGAKGIMRKLRSGDRIRMNGATGKIELINEE